MPAPLATRLRGWRTRLRALGAVHLLLHGIWAFKVDIAGERTDLVLQERLAITADIEIAADAFVLTEWKRAAGPAHAAAKSEEAREQARIHGQSALAATDLRAARYIILVTEDRLAVSSDIVDGGVLYRHVNVAVRPSSPSVAARFQANARFVAREKRGNRSLRQTRTGRRRMRLRGRLRTIAQARSLP